MDVDTGRRIVRMNALTNAVKYYEKQGGIDHKTILKTAKLFEEWIYRVG